jgi:DNA polymerase III delta subunit
MTMSSLILISGEEDFLMERAAMQEASSSLSSEVNEYMMPGEIESYKVDSQIPLMSGKTRVFILWEVKDIPMLPDNDGDTLICISPSGKRVLQDKRAKRSLIFPKLKSFSDNNEVIKWILREGESFNIDLSRIAGALFVNSGTCLRKINSEIEKFAAAFPPDTVVSPTEARSLMVFSAEITPRDIIDSICDGYTAKAITYYDKMQERAEETGWIIAYMQRHVLQQLRFEEALERKLSYEHMSEILGVHPFVLKKLLITRRGLWSKKSLTMSFQNLCDLDVSHKRGDESAKFGLELEIIKMSEEASNVKR